ncbi:hypothetical protein [Streptomyces sp. NPDC046909]
MQHGEVLENTEILLTGDWVDVAGSEQDEFDAVVVRAQGKPGNVGSGC